MVARLLKRRYRRFAGEMRDRRREERTALGFLPELSHRGARPPGNRERSVEAQAHHHPLRRRAGLLDADGERRGGDARAAEPLSRHHGAASSSGTTGGRSTPGATPSSPSSPASWRRCAARSRSRIRFRPRTRACRSEQQMWFRIGINLGDVMIDRDDLYGDGVNVAQRLQALAEPGGVMVSGTVYSLAHKQLALAFDFAGEQEVTDGADRVPSYRVRMSGRNAPEVAEESTAEPQASAQPAAAPQPTSMIASIAARIEAAARLAQAPAAACPRRGGRDRLPLRRSTSSPTGSPIRGSSIRRYRSASGDLPAISPRDGAPARRAPTRARARRGSRLNPTLIRRRALSASRSGNPEPRSADRRGGGTLIPKVKANGAEIPAIGFGTWRSSRR